MWNCYRGALPLIVALLLSAGSAIADEASNTDLNQQQETKSKSCMNLCLQDGEDEMSCLDYCTMVATIQLPVGQMPGGEASRCASVETLRATPALRAYRF